MLQLLKKNFFGTDFYTIGLVYPEFHILDPYGLFLKKMQFPITFWLIYQDSDFQLVSNSAWSAFPSWVLIVVKNWLNNSIKADYRLLSIYAYKTLLHSLTCTTVLPRENKPYLNRLNVKFSMDGMGKFKAVPDIIVYH